MTLLTAGLGFFPVTSFSGPENTKGGPMELKAAASITETLKTAETEKQRVEIYLRNGAKFEGTVQSISNYNVVLAKLSGREFYDAIIKIDEISAIVARARDH